MRTIQDLAKDVDRAQEQLNRAKAALLAALSSSGGTVPRTRAVPQQPGRRRGPGSDSIAARVLSLVQQAGAAGVSRAELVQELGESAAVHSALKRYSGLRQMVSRDGRWVTTDKEGTGQKETPKAGRAKGAK